MDYQKLCLQVQEIVRTAGKFIREEREKISASDVELKSVASLVTYVDKNAEQQIVSALINLIPNSGFVAEEAGYPHHIGSLGPGLADTTQIVLKILVNLAKFVNCLKV